jgi:hypothetical protein
MKPRCAKARLKIKALSGFAAWLCGKPTAFRPDLPTLLVRLRLMDGKAAPCHR